MSILSARLGKLEIARGGIRRLVVVSGPADQHADALARLPIKPTTSDLLVMITKPAGSAVMASVDGEPVAFV